MLELQGTAVGLLEELGSLNDTAFSLCRGRLTALAEQLATVD